MPYSTLLTTLTLLTGIAAAQAGTCTHTVPFNGLAKIGENGECTFQASTVTATETVDCGPCTTAVMQNIGGIGPVRALPYSSPRFFPLLTVDYHDSNKRTGLPWRHHRPRHNHYAHRSLLFRSACPNRNRLCTFLQPWWANHARTFSDCIKELHPVLYLDTGVQSRG